MVGLTSKIKPHELTQQSWKRRRRGPTWQTKPKTKKNQRIRCQIFWLTYQINKKPKEKTPNRDCKSKK